MKELKFSYNWNKKLDCKVFTTLRLTNFFDIGDEIDILLNSKKICVGKIIYKKCININQINDWIAYLDTGYDKIECKKILEKMYKNKNIDWKTQKIYFYLIKKI